MLSLSLPKPSTWHSTLVVCMNVTATLFRHLYDVEIILHVGASGDEKYNLPSAAWLRFNLLCFVIHTGVNELHTILRDRICDGYRRPCSSWFFFGYGGRVKLTHGPPKTLLTYCTVTE